MSSGCNNISSLPAVSPENRVVNKFISDFNANAYVIDFDNICLVNRKGLLQLPQLNYYDGLVNNLLINIEGKGNVDIKTDITFRPVFNNTEDRWIPNTEESCTPFQVYLNAVDSDQNTYDLLERLRVKIIKPIDPYWDTYDAGNCNINRNKGDCDFMLYATNFLQTEEYWLATFNIILYTLMQKEIQEMIWNITSGWMLIKE